MKEERGRKEEGRRGERRDDKLTTLSSSLLSFPPSRPLKLIQAHAPRTFVPA